MSDMHTLAAPAVAEAPEGCGRLRHEVPGDEESGARVQCLAVVEFEGGAAAHLWSGSAQGRISVHDAISGTELIKLAAPKSPSAVNSSEEDFVCCLAAVIADPSAVGVWAGSSDGSIAVFDATAGAQRCIAQLLGHEGSVSCLAYTPGSATVWSGSGDKTLRGWDALTGQNTFILKGHENWVRSLCSDSVSNALWSGADDCTVRVWDGQSGKDLSNNKASTGGIMSLVAVPSMNQVWSGSADKAIFVWDAATMQLLHELHGHQGWVTALCTVGSEASTQVWSASSDKSVRVWNALSRRCVRIIEAAHRGWVWSLAAARDEIVWSGGGDAGIHAWNTGLVEQERPASAQAPLHVSANAESSRFASALREGNTMSSTSNGPSQVSADRQIQELLEQRVALLDTLDEYEEELRSREGQPKLLAPVADHMRRILAENFAPSIAFSTKQAADVSRQAAQALDGAVSGIPTDLPASQYFNDIADLLGGVCAAEVQRQRDTHRQIEESLHASVVQSATAFAQVEDAEQRWRHLVEQSTEFAALCQDRVQVDTRTIATLLVTCGRLKSELVASAELIQQLTGSQATDTQQQYDNERYSGPYSNASDTVAYNNGPDAGAYDNGPEVGVYGNGPSAGAYENSPDAGIYVNGAAAYETGLDAGSYSEEDGDVDNASEYSPTEPYVADFSPPNKSHSSDPRGVIDGTVKDLSFQNYSDDDDDDDEGLVTGTVSRQRRRQMTSLGESRRRRERARSIERSLDASLQNLKDTAAYFDGGNYDDGGYAMSLSSSEEESDEENDRENDHASHTIESRYENLVKSMESSRRRLSKELSVTRRSRGKFSVSSNSSNR